MPSSGGSVIVDKIYEPLQVAIQAYNDQISELTEISKKLQEYPNARAEKVALATNSQLIRDTQTMLEGPPPAIVRGPVSQHPSLETIPEATPSVEIESAKADSVYQKNDLHADLTKQASEARMLEDGIPEVEEQMASKVWEAVRRHADEERSLMATPPFSFINLDDETSFHWKERKVMQENKEIPLAYRSKKVPSHLTYGGRSEHNSYIIIAPSLHRP